MKINRRCCTRVRTHRVVAQIVQTSCAHTLHVRKHPPHAARSQWLHEATHGALPRRTMHTPQGAPPTRSNGTPRRLGAAADVLPPLHHAAKRTWRAAAAAKLPRETADGGAAGDAVAVLASQRARFAAAEAVDDAPSLAPVMRHDEGRFPEKVTASILRCRAREITSHSFTNR